MWSPMLAFIVTGIPRSANSRLTASPSSIVWNITAIDAIPSPRSAMNCFHRLGPSSGSSSSKFSVPTITSAPLSV